MRAAFLLDFTEASGEASLFWSEHKYVSCHILDEGVRVDILGSFFRAEVESLSDGSLLSLNISFKSLS